MWEKRRNLTSFDGKVIFKLVIVSSNIDLVSWFEDYWLSRALYLRGIGWSKVIIGVFERISSVVYLIWVVKWCDISGLVCWFGWWNGVRLSWNFINGLGLRSNMPTQIYAHWSYSLWDTNRLLTFILSITIPLIRWLYVVVVLDAKLQLNECVVVMLYMV